MMISFEFTTFDLKIAKVNGQDLTNATHEESLKALQSAPEPIIIEVLRRSSLSQCPGNSATSSATSSTPSLVTASTQTEKALDGDYCSLLELHSAAIQEMYPFIPGGELMQPSCRQGVCFSPSVELGLTDIEMGNDDDEPIYDDPWDITRPSFLSGLEIEYEDVTLLRNNADDKLGLTLCYENHGSSEDEEPLTDVYVSEIEADSIAAQNGRIREGDQILQINSTEIHSRDQAIKLFSENSSEVTVTVARHVLQVDDGFVEDKHTAAYGRFPMLAEGQRPEFLDVAMFEGLEEGGSTDTASTSKSKQDSGLGRTDDSIKAEESSEHECLDPDCQERCCHSNDSFTSNDTPDSMSPDQVVLSNQLLPGYHCDKTSDALGKNCTYSNCDQGCARHLDFHGNVTGKPPRSPGNKSDSAVCMSSGNTSCKSDSSSQSSPSSSYPNPSDHIYDEPVCNKSAQKSNANNSYRHEIDQINQEIENMRIECRKMHASNRAELHKAAASPNKSEPLRSPRIVPRMGTRLDYLRQIQAIHQFNQMGSWRQGSHGDYELNGNHGNAKDTAVFSNQPYCVSTVTAPEVTLQNNTDTSEYLCNQTDTVEYKESSNTSAYNTGESCRSTPLRLQLQPPKPEEDGGGGWNMSMLSLAVSNVQSGARTPPSDGEEQETKLKWCENNSLLKSETKQNPNRDSRKKGRSSSRPRPKEGEKCPMVKSESSSSVSHMTQTPADNLRELYTQYADVMYTNQANLQHTMRLQQKLFQQQLLVQQAKQAKLKSSPSPAHKSHSSDPKDSKRHKSHPSHDASAKKKCKSQSSSNASKTVPSYPEQYTCNVASPSEMHNPGSQQQSSRNGTDRPSGGQGSSGSDNGKVEKFEWVVKMRPDGSRYITRRPVRNKMLRERAKKLYEERCGMTTDDDAISELKVGRYWSKDERKRHLEKAREYKKKKELVLKQKADALKESDEKGAKEPNIVELSHKKMMKAKIKKTLDDFTTVQEMMVHGSRHAENVNKTLPNPLLSVTTV